MLILNFYDIAVHACLNTLFVWVNYLKIQYIAAGFISFHNNFDDKNHGFQGFFSFKPRLFNF